MALFGSASHGGGGGDASHSNTVTKTHTHTHTHTHMWIFSCPKCYDVMVSCTVCGVIGVLETHQKNIQTLGGEFSSLECWCFSCYVALLPAGVQSF